MATHFKIEIPCKTYIKKYLFSRYGFPLLASASSSFGDIVLTKLIDRTRTKLSNYDVGIRLKSYTDSVKVLIPIDYWYKTNQDITPSAIIRINKFCEDQFLKELYDFVTAAVKFGTERKTAIEQFSDSRGILIEIDVTFECLSKMEFRARKAIEAINKNAAALAMPHDVKTAINLHLKNSLPSDKSQLSLF